MTDKLKNLKEKIPNNNDIKKSKEDILEMIINERNRQFNLPGSEWDAIKAPNDWISVANHYLSEESRRNSELPKKEDFEESLVKSAAIILAALEHIDIMKKNKTLK